MNMDNPFEAQTGGPPSGTGRALSRRAVLDRTVVEEKLSEQSAAPEQLSPSFLAACHCSTETSLLDQELEYLWEDGGAPGKFYEIYLGKISRNPIVKSKISGKFFVLPWSVIIKLAVERGIDR
jgi:hypothetical protein